MRIRREMPRCEVFWTLWFRIPSSYHGYNQQFPGTPAQQYLWESEQIGNELYNIYIYIYIYTQLQTTDTAEEMHCM